MAGAKGGASNFRLLTAVVLWYAFSIGLIMYNKWMMSYAGFRFPVALMLLHQGMATCFSFIIIKVLGLVSSPNLTFHQVKTKVLPVAVVFSMSIMLVNQGQLRLTVSFLQMLKASIPFWTVLITFGLGLEPFQPKLVATVMWIGLGVIVAAKGELAFDTLGTSLAVAGIICECVRLVLSQKLLQSAEIKFNPITGVFYTAPLSFLTLMIPFLLLERHEFGEFIFGVDAVTGRMKLWEIMPHMIGNGCMAFMLNLVVFNFIQVSSAITTGVAGKAKDVMNVVIAAWIFRTTITPLQIVGYSIALSGVCFYAYGKLMKKMKPSHSEQELPLTSSHTK